MENQASDTGLSVSISPELLPKPEPVQPLLEQLKQSQQSIAVVGNIRSFAPEELLRNNVYIGNFKLLKLLGQGGMGAVYLGEHVEIGKQVAIKVLNPELAYDREALSRFLGEARLVTKLKHPSIVDVYDCGVIAGIGRYLVMEYLDGEDLHTIFHRQGALSPREAALLAAQILDALDNAHKLGIVHQDIKPPNIFLSRANNQTVAKLLDFGIAKFVGGTAKPELDDDEDAVILGTPAYMSPEQAAAEANLDARADIYSMGVILFEMITGRRPFLAKNLRELFHKIDHEKPPAPSQFAPGLPSQLEQLILRALEKKRELRPQSAGEFRQELLTLVPSLPIQPLSSERPQQSAAVARKQNATPGYGKGQSKQQLVAVSAAQIPEARPAPAIPAEAQPSFFPQVSQNLAPNALNRPNETKTSGSAWQSPSTSTNTSTSTSGSAWPGASTSGSAWPGASTSTSGSAWPGMGSAAVAQPASPPQAESAPSLAKRLANRAEEKPKKEASSAEQRVIETVALRGKEPEPEFRRSSENLSTLIAERDDERRGKRIAWGVAILMAGLAALSFLVPREPSTPEPPPPPPRPQVADDLVLLDSEPSEATIIGASGEIRGKTPLAISVPAEGMEIRVHADGYMPVRIPLKRPAPQRMVIPLAKEAAAQEVLRPQEDPEQAKLRKKNKTLKKALQ